MIRQASHKAFANGIPAIFAFLAPLTLVVASIGALWSMAAPSLEETSSVGSALGALLSDVYVMRAVRFTLMQAALSALLSTLLAIPLARALATRDFPGKGAVLSLFGAPFILPVIVAILGLLAIWGKNGPIHALVTGTGIANFSIYGLPGILLAHIFFNLPLATRILLQGWLAIPSEQWRLASQLGMSSSTIARHIEWPMLKERLPGVLAIIFLLCATSFTVVLALGGGPKATTIELAIYQAIRYDFDLERAALLACLQIILCAGLAVISRLIAQDHDTGESLGGAVQRGDRTSIPARLMDWSIIILALAFLAMPLLAAFLRGAHGLMMNPFDAAALLPAALRSIAVAMGACLVMGLISLPLAQLSIHLKGKTKRLVELPGFAIMVAPPIALGAGLFILLHQHIPIDRLASATHRTAQRAPSRALRAHLAYARDGADQTRLWQTNPTARHGAQNGDPPCPLAIDAQAHRPQSWHYGSTLHRRSGRHCPLWLANSADIAALSLSANGRLPYGSGLWLRPYPDLGRFCFLLDFRQRTGWP